MPRGKVGQTIGRLGEAEMLAFNRMLAFVLGLGDALSFSEGARR